uniref:PNPLA domain-containing protein n=1 Tax=Acrobeloides nanus TaxID=290746 RepID=A0A914C526_9BILA
YPIDWDAIDWDAIDWDALELDTNTNIARIARFVSGYALGVAFGGGGAKGAAHYGILNELLMKEVPVDMVGGTSIGAFFGGLVAFAHLHTSTATTDMIDLIKEHLHTCFEKLGSSLDYWKNIINVAIKQATDKLPFSSDDLDKILNPIFKETCIEELSIPFFSVSTNISNSSMRVHCIGKNVLLRKCIAASMSLPGYYQPVIDDDSAHLVDGGCVNLLPADIMKAHGAYHVIAIDVGSIPKFVTEYQNRHKKVSKEDVQSTSIKPLDNVSSSATIVASQNLECLKTLDYCTYLRPVLKNPTSVNDDINNFKIDAFNKIGKILVNLFGHFYI